MAHYIPDHKLKEANELIDSLDNSNESDLIRYLISEKDETIKEQNLKLEKYHDWFKSLDSFLPTSNPFLN